MGLANQRVGPWQLLDRLGSGGNADVWRATDGSGRDVALKVLHRNKASNDRYRRFRREIEVLRQLGKMDGILPFIDAYLPENPSRRDLPWLAMPVATPIRAALAEVPLEQVVRALAAVARTLARLHDVHDVAHRDIKPGNLYRYEDNWVVGDFGLVAVPNLDELTRTGKPLGAAHYMPYEMLADPKGADPKPADVYALAKTLWVLSTGRKFPVEGHQPAATRGLSIREAIHHPRASFLDQLIDRATKLDPQERPPMRAVATGLEDWIALPEPVTTIDIESARERLREQIAQELVATDLADARKDLALKATRRLAELFAPLNQAMRDLHPRATIDREPDEFTRNVLRTLDVFGSPEIVYRYQRLSSASRGDPLMPYALRLGRAVELTADGLLIVWLYINVSHPSVMGSDFHWMPPQWQAPVDSMAVEQMLVQAVSAAAEQLPKAAAAFAHGPA